MSGTGSNNEDQSPEPHAAHSLEPLLLDQVDPRKRGQAHGEHWRDAIHQLARIRLESTLRRSAFASEEAVLEAARLHLPVLREHLPELADELAGIAQGADLSPQRVVVLNQADDLRDLPAPGTAADDGPPAASEDLGGSTSIYFNGDRGPLLGQTLDLQAEVEPYVRMLRIAPTGGEHEILCLTLAGCLGLAGIASTGVTVAANDLRSADGRVGVVWPAAVRAMLASPNASAAYQRLRATPLSGGHYYMIADGHDYYGVETSGQHCVLTQLGPRAAHLHTNHCFDPILRRHEAVPLGSTTHPRLNLATTIYAQQRPRTADALWSLLHTRDGTRGSVCIDPSPAAGPTATCAVIVMRLHEGWVRVVRGAEHRSPPLELTVQRWRGQPTPPSSQGA